MKIIDDLIDQLSDEKIPLSNVLFKAKVLAHKLKSTEIINWINSELNGYAGEALPPYRIIPAVLLGNATNGAWQYTEQPLPIMHLSEGLRASLETMKLNQSVSTLEDFAKGTGGTLVHHVEPELCSLISKGLAHGYKVQSAAVQIGQAHILQVITQIRSKLLDFLLVLGETFKGETGESKTDSPESKQSIHSLFNSSVFGNNTTIIVGDNNTQIVSISKGNFGDVEEVLKRNGVSHDDIDELRTVIDSDTPDHSEKKIGKKVSSWMSKMISKSLDSTWQIKVGVASELLSQIIMRYYGWN